MTPLPWQEAIFLQQSSMVSWPALRTCERFSAVLGSYGLKWLNKVKLTFWVRKWKPEVERLERGRRDCFLSSQTCAWVHRAAETPRTWSTAVHTVTVRTLLYRRGTEQWYYCGDHLGNRYQLLKLTSFVGSLEQPETKTKVETVVHRSHHHHFDVGACLSGLMLRITTAKC